MSQKRLKGISISRPIVYGNTAWRMSDEERGESDHTHRWTLAVRSACAPEPSAGQKSGREPPEIGGADDLSYFIKRVTFKLHETYPNSLRSIDKPPFQITETGWGEFEAQIRIFFEPSASEKPIGPFMHNIKLHPWTAPVLLASNNVKPLPRKKASASAEPVEKSADAGPSAATEGSEEKKAEGEDKPPADDDGDEDDSMAIDPPAKTEIDEAPKTPVPEEPAPDKPTHPPAVVEAEMEEAGEEAEPEELVIADSPVHSYQYDEIVFHEPLESFYNLLIQYPPTVLPKEPRLPKADPMVPLGVGGNVGEITQDTEKREADRLEYARLQTVAEIDNIRKKIMEHEKTLESLKTARGEAT